MRLALESRSSKRTTSSAVVNLMDGGDSVLSSGSKSAETCKSHKEAERRRRQRINAHLSTLRSLLPNTTKTDKASLLAEVVHRVQELQEEVADVARQDGGLWCGFGTGSGPESWPFPGESDEASLSYCDGEPKLVKAIVCCEDRPGLSRDMARAIGSVRVRPIRAEIMTVGERTKNVVVMQCVSGGSGVEEDIRALRRALKAVVENRASGFGLGQIVSGNKRARIH
ncbi:Basic helix-loop-helix transcription factor [Parasponia andersonii]|uniref:Basic helix-loop-helix transcription factor n=1 Tax=Parasponia andersonii TaxID=3476 RepID=A0A2P5CR55_PARAD|nr:Basic helix-loop-helix transcription factor [Parasponia andersonii]